jgi:glycosyltransferase involved in cell wall biosynthesis
MRILSISNDPHDPGNGSGYVITGYVEGLRDRGHTVDAYGPEDWRLFHPHRGRRYVYPVLMALFGLRTYLSRSCDYDLVEVWGGASWLLAVLLKSIWPSLCVVHHSNGIEQHRIAVEQASGLESVESTWFQVDFSAPYDWGLHACDAIITVGSYDVPFLEQKAYVPPERIYAIENPLPDMFLDRDVSLDQRPARIGFCGSWLPRKGLQVMRSDVAEFLREHPSWTFSVVGSRDVDVKGGFPSGVRDQIDVTPFMPRDDLIEWYHSLSVFMLPSIYESFGMVAAEAMACGAAAVTTNVGFAHGLTHGEEVFKLEAPTSPHLYEALTKLATDEALRRTLAANGYERVQSLSWERALDRLETAYTTLTHA